MARSKVSSEERIFSLVLALVASTQGLTKHELLSSVYGYSDRYQDSAQRIALDRQFERDKEQLRELGIPVDTIDSPGEPGNNQLARYRISKESLEVPQGLQFSDRELMLLRMAVLAWREGSLTTDSRRAAMKLESLGAGTQAPSPGVNAGFGATEPSAPALLAAIESQQVALFDYHLPGRAAPLARRVYPLQLHRFEGRWHLIALDLDRDEVRVFLLSRISGSVIPRTALETEPDPPATDIAIGLIARATEELHELLKRQHVTVRVRTHSIAEAQLAPRAEATHAVEAGSSRELKFGTTDMHELAPYLAGFGSDVEVLEPAGLRDAVATLLRLVHSAHVGVQVTGGSHG